VSLASVVCKHGVINGVIDPDALLGLFLQRLAQRVEVGQVITSPCDRPFRRSCSNTADLFPRHLLGLVNADFQGLRGHFYRTLPDASSMLCVMPYLLI